MQVTLANPQEVKSRRGHKTDKKDAWWLAAPVSAWDDSCQLLAGAAGAGMAHADPAAARKDPGGSDREEPAALWPPCRGPYPTRTGSCCGKGWNTWRFWYSRSKS